jgi:hypothetical protein
MLNAAYLCPIGFWGRGECVHLQRSWLTGYCVCILYGTSRKVNDILLRILRHLLVKPEYLVDSIVLHSQSIRPLQIRRKAPESSPVGLKTSQIGQ